MALLILGQCSRIFDEVGIVKVLYLVSHGNIGEYQARFRDEIFVEIIAPSKFRVHSIRNVVDFLAGSYTISVRRHH